MQAIDTTNFDGFFDVLATTERSQAASMILSAGQSTGGPANAHRDSDQWLYVLEGSGSATIAGSEYELQTGDLVCIEAGETHEIIADPDEALRTFSIYAPAEY